eukprot:COSAG04_NODE_267_length_18528_cov_60.607141_22_plen_88_part_00
MRWWWAVEDHPWSSGALACAVGGLLLTRVPAAQLRSLLGLTPPSWAYGVLVAIAVRPSKPTASPPPCPIPLPNLPAMRVLISPPWGL